MWDTRELYKGTVSSVLIVVVTLVALVLGGELFLSMKRPFNTNTWPGRFDERVGWTFVPGATINLTNHVDFWSSAKVNSLGFLDREPPPYKRADVCRLIFIGDSYVEAAQVAIEEKLHVVFEQLAHEHITDGRHFETIALGYSGTGQVNQLPFYDVFGRPLRPDVVVLVFTSNDFANNSTALESVRYGWHPLHPPRLFFAYDRVADTFTPIPIDPAWQDFLLPSLPMANHRPKMVLWLENKSYLYNWLYTGFLKNSQIPAVQQFSSWLSGQTPVLDIYRYRKNAIENLDGFSDVFRNWSLENNVNLIDGQFKTEKLSPVFEEAVLITGHAFDEFLQRSQQDGFRLVVFITDSLSVYGEGQNAKIVKLLEDRGIPYINHYDYIISQRGLPMQGRYAHDGHWNTQGHQWAAHALLEYYQAHPELCKH